MVWTPYDQRVALKLGKGYEITKKMSDLLLSNLKHFHDKGSAAVFMLIIIK
jgi:hypothetical protein